MSFSQLPAVEKDTEKWAAGKFLGPSYFEATLLYRNFRTLQILIKIMMKGLEQNPIMYQMSSFDLSNLTQN